MSPISISILDRPSMPVISRFFGIVIRMYVNDHEPAHFHAVYAEDEALVVLDTLEVYRGQLPARALALVREWAKLHQAELRRDWDLTRAGQLPEPIAPLE